MSKIWAICGGDDWCDASIDHVIIPDGMDLKREQEERGRAVAEWYRTGRERGIEWPGTFVEWLIKKGATEPSGDI